MKKLNRKELSSLIRVCTDEADARIERYNLYLPDNPDYKKYRKELEESEPVKRYKNLVTECNQICEKTFGTRSHSVNPGSAVNAYLQSNLSVRFPQKQKYGRPGNYDRRYHLAESIVTVANSEVDENYNLKYKDVQEFREAMVDVLFDKANL